MRLLAPNCSSFSHITHTKILRLSHLSSIISDFFPVNFAQKRAEKKNARNYPLREKIKFISIDAFGPNGFPRLELGDVVHR